MFLTTYQSVAEFLVKTQPIMETNEAANSLMLGICFRLQKFPERIKHDPYLATVEDDEELVLAAVMTPPHNVMVYRHRDDAGQAYELVAQNLLAHQWPAPGVVGPSNVSRAFADTWTSLTNQSYRQHLSLRIHELRRVIPPKSVPGNFRLATEADAGWLTQWAIAFEKEALGHEDLDRIPEMVQNKITDREIYVWEDGQPVSIAATARPMVKGITVNLVYTPPELRGRGYASACVATLSQLMLDSGRQYCCLFTDLANPTSNKIYRQIGYLPICDFNEYVFEER